MKLLIANRGEIALRIQRTAQRMGIQTVAIYSKYDREAQHVIQANESVMLRGESLAETYLNIDAIIAAAKQTGATAIHPGYGFLSENPLFSEACEREDIVFIGPSADSVRAMGNKIAAREVAVKLGVPVTSGVTGTPDELLKKHAVVGFPMLIKAAAGGGGKGMRIVRSEPELAAALETTSREALNYFGDGTIYIEKFIEGPRHIEVQVLGDKHGNMVHLFERECSAQRRHQKVVEEAPSPTLTPDVRHKMGESAVKLASSIGYYSAGTIEFLVDKDLNYYFLEMNTRIQVEHPVTEMTTGIDLVEEQIRIAGGETLRLKQQDLKQTGHAIECRIYAEDPANNFMPSPGFISLYHEPSGLNIRVDSMEIEGSGQIHSFFDPMIGKLIIWGETREEARKRMINALENYVVQGIKTNISFLSAIMQHLAFIDNTITTRYIDDHLEDLTTFTGNLKKGIDPEVPLMAGFLKSLGIRQEESGNIWQSIGYWRHLKEPSASMDGEIQKIRITGQEGNRIKFELSDSSGEAMLSTDGLQSRLCLNGVSHVVYVGQDAQGGFPVTYKGFEFEVGRPDMAGPENVTFSESAILNNDSGNIVSPMPGKVLKVNVAEGEAVTKGQVLMVVEAMKMENNILSSKDAVVEKLLVKEGDMVDGSQKLMQLYDE
ncbi:MAG: acetyl-CoA carboxylase biotin carboxylase subunit [Lentimicrobium sp.]|jgi:acetyl-CoA carboxylase biotin carboxylase subunit|nr:acetyl-CoA carboxylase biotin carboxylase subunit [Lentimicrobium sp.]